MIFSFAGNRTYIRGSDIYKYINNLHKNFVRINLIFKKKIISKPIINKLELKGNSDFNSKNKKNDAICEVSLKSKNIFYFFKNSKKKITNKYIFDEALLENSFKIDQREKIINFSGNSDLDKLEILVSMNKKINEFLFKAKSKKWIVSRISINRNIKNYKKKKLKLKIIKFIKNKHTISEVYDNNIFKGYLFFNLV